MDHEDTERTRRDTYTFLYLTLHNRDEARNYLLDWKLPSEKEQEATTELPKDPLGWAVFDQEFGPHVNLADYFKRKSDIAEDLKSLGEERLERT